MKKILFISTRYPFPIFGADKLRSFDILKFLSKKNKIDLVCLGDKKEIKNKNLSFCSSVKVFQLNFISRIITGSLGVQPDLFTAGYFNTTSAIDAIQFKMSSGNIDSGTITLYGIN